MVRTFTHDDPGTTEQVWAKALATRVLEPLDVDGGLQGITRVVVLAAHPDDETLGVGGLVHRAHGAGLRVTLVVATDGDRSHPHSPTTSPAELAELRRAEVASALDLLAPGAAPQFLGLADGDLAAQQDTVTDRLVEVIGLDGPHCLLVAPWRHDGHTDHDAAGRAAAAAAHRTDARLVEYPIWLWHWGTPQDVPWSSARGVSLTSADRATKAAAAAAHLTQTAPLSPAPGDEALLSPGVLAHFARDTEVVFVDGALADDALERLHQGQADPWGVDSRWYERRKRALTLAALPRERYARALELGCSVGALADELRARCEQLLAIDSSAAALRRARSRLDGATGVELGQYAFPQEWPRGRFDLVVLSEVGYFLSPARLDALATRIEQSLEPGADIVLCHWRPQPRGLVLDGDAVHARLRARPGWTTTSRHVETDFVLEVLSHVSEGQVR